MQTSKFRQLLLRNVLLGADFAESLTKPDRHVAQNLALRHVADGKHPLTT